MDIYRFSQRTADASKELEYESQLVHNCTHIKYIRMQDFSSGNLNIKWHIKTAIHTLKAINNC